MCFVLDKKFKPKALLVFLVLAIFLSFSFFVRKEKQTVQVIATSPISCFETKSPIYTVIGIDDGKATLKSLTLFGEICSGFGVKPTVFSDTKRIKNMIGIFSKINGFECDYGIICENTSGLTRSEFLKHLALLNDEFYLTVGKHSLCCYINGTNSLYASDVMASYGQYGITYSVLSGKSDLSLKGGDIVAVNLSDESSIYDFASLVSYGSANGLKTVPIKEYLQEYELISES